MDFGTLYAQNCAGCHGAEGRGGAAIALANPVYLAIIDETTMRKIATNGIRGTSMPAFARSAGGMLTEQQIEAITSGIFSRWGRKGILNGANPPSYAAKAAGNVDHGQPVLEHIAHPAMVLKAEERPREAPSRMIHIPGPGQRSGTAHDRDHRQAGAGRTRLARRCPRTSND